MTDAVQTISILNSELERIIKAMPGILKISDIPLGDEIYGTDDTSQNETISAPTVLGNLISDFRGLNTFIEGLDINSITSGIQALTQSGSVTTDISSTIDINTLKNGISLPSSIQNIAQMVPQVAQPLISKIDESVSVAPKMISEMDPTTISTMSDLLDSSVTNGFPNNIVSGGSPGDITEALTSAVPDINTDEIKSVISGITNIQTQLPDLQSFVSEYIKGEVFNNVSNELNGILDLFNNLVPSITGNPLVDINLKMNNQIQSLFDTLNITDTGIQQGIMQMLYNGDDAGAINKIESLIGDLSNEEEESILTKLEDILGN